MNPEALDGPALDHLTVSVESARPGGALDEPSFGAAAVEILLTFLGSNGLGLGPKVSARVREIESGLLVLDIPCGGNQDVATRVADSVRHEMEHLTVRGFLDEYRVSEAQVSEPWLWRRAYLGIGSNLGDRVANLQGAVDGLAATRGITVTGVSRIYETDPVGGPEQPEFLNAAIAIETRLSAYELLGIAQSLEEKAERVRKERWGPRTLDVDVLILGDEQVDDLDLEIPHPRIRTRGFVLAPLFDFLPAGIIPEPEHGWPGVHETDLSLRLP